MKLISKEMAKHLAEYHDAKKVSIEQELESGLEKYYKSPGGGAKMAYAPTRIFLPAAKYKEYAKYCAGRGFSRERDSFHDIPVFSTNDKVITYCTD